MKTRSRISTMLLAAAALTLLFAVPALAKTKKVTYWEPLKETSYSYEDGKWVREDSRSQTYKKNRLMTFTYVSYRRWDEDAEKMVDQKETSKETYKYDKKGRVKSFTTYENGKKTTKAVYTYDKKGRESGHKLYNKKGKLISTTTVKYNSKGQTKSVTVKYKDKKKKTEKDTYTYKYYSGKKVKKETIKFADGSKLTMEYDKKGNQTKWSRTDKDYSSTEYYNSKGQLTKEESKSGSYSSVTVYIYDKKGNKTKSVETWTDVYDGEKQTGTTTRTYEIERDKNGNVTTEIEYYENEPSRKTVYSKYKKFTYTVK